MSKRTAGSLDPEDVPAAKVAKKEEEVWITVRQGEWRIEVLRRVLYAANEAKDDAFFRTAIDHDTNELELVAGTCATKVDFMYFFGTAIRNTGIDADFTLDEYAQRAINLLHIGDYCGCKEFVDALLMSLGDEAHTPMFTAAQLLELGTRYYDDDLLEHAADLYVLGPEVPAEALQKLWPIYQKRMVHNGKVVDVEAAADAVTCFLRSVGRETQLCTNTCNYGCTGTGAAGHARRRIDTMDTSDFGRDELDTIEEVASALGI
jgi:hypothetical protein